MRFLLFTIITFIISIHQAPDSPKNYPLPIKTKELMFYIQRNHNSNTIVYEANFDENGMLNDKEPLLVSWIRYEEESQRMELRTIEKWYAYGFKARKAKEKKGVFEIQLVAYKDRKLILSQSSPFEAYVTIEIENKESLLDHIYIQADNSGVWPKVEYIELFGFEKNNGQNKYEKIFND